VVQLAPPRIADEAGVFLAVRLLEFVGRDAPAVSDWYTRRSPLGMTSAQSPESAASAGNRIRARRGSRKSATAAPR
jgi:hypothetical protein